MKYIGATDRFIRIPFVLEGLIIGFSAAIVALPLRTLS
jgi:cell division protein FtsX